MYKNNNIYKINYMSESIVQTVLGLCQAWCCEEAGRQRRARPGHGARRKPPPSCPGAMSRGLRFVHLQWQAGSSSRPAAGNNGPWVTR